MIEFHGIVTDLCYCSLKTQKPQIIVNVHIFQLISKTKHNDAINEYQRQ